MPDGVVPQMASITQVVPEDDEIRTPRSQSHQPNAFIYTDDKQPMKNEDAMTSLLLDNEYHDVVALKQAPPFGMISPLNIWRVRWEFMMQLLIVFQAVLVPFELAFLSNFLMVTSVGWFVVEVFIMLIFLFDMVLTFRTGVSDRGCWVDYDTFRVAKRYLKSWFVVDFVAWLPSALALIVPAEAETEDGYAVSLTRLSKSVRFARVVRLLRVLQLARLMRVRHSSHRPELKLFHGDRAAKWLQQVETSLAVALCLHLVACLWGAVAPLEEHHLGMQGLGPGASTWSRYLLALWWASCALTVGGQPSPWSNEERALAVFVNLANVAILCGLVAWSIGAFSHRGEHQKELMARVKAASQYASEYKLPQQLMLEVHQAILHDQHSKRSTRDFKQMVEGCLSQDLCQRVYGWVHCELLRRFPPFSEDADQLFPGCKAVPERFLWQLAYEAKITTFMAGDRVTTMGDKAETMGFILEGSLLMLSPKFPRPLVLREKYWFGEPVLIFEHIRGGQGQFRWVSKHSTRAASIMALEPSILLEIGQDSFRDAVGQYNLLNCWLLPVVEHLKSGKATLGCSCCRQLDHWIPACPAAEFESPLERLHLARQAAQRLPGHSARDPPRPKWLPTMGPGNMNVPPEEWGMTVRQWCAFIMACCFTGKWGELEESTEYGKEAGHVNLYQVCECMVKPWTRNTGNSVALLMNASKPLKADVMISHAWGESVLETLMAVLGKASVTGITLDTAIWFCTFAQYQPGDMRGDCGPGVQEQLALDPFKRVIESRPRFGMLVVHTSTAELYSRLWCVYEVNEARASDVRAVSAYSMGALKKLQDLEQVGSEVEVALQVNTSQATCWSRSDAEMIRRKILSCGGFKQLDERILDFRRASVEVFCAMFRKFMEWAGSGDQEKSTFEGFTEVVHSAGVFVGLHCLAPYVEETHDAEMGAQLMARAKDILELWDRTFVEEMSPPPCVDPKKICQRPDPADEAQVQACLLDLRRHPFAVGLLEMAAGGNLPALLSCAVSGTDPAGPGTLQRAFRQWTAGSLRMRKEDLQEVLVQEGLGHLQHELEAQFPIADANTDGLLDLLEFEAWLGTALE